MFCSSYSHCQVPQFELLASWKLVIFVIGIKDAYPVSAGVDADFVEDSKSACAVIDPPDIPSITLAPFLSLKRVALGFGVNWLFALLVVEVW